jgi:hypothetical protein
VSQVGLKLRGPHRILVYTDNDNLLGEIIKKLFIRSFCSLSYDRSVASSKASSPYGAI